MKRTDWLFYLSLYKSPETMKFIAEPFSTALCQKYFNYYFSEKYLNSKSKLFIIDSLIDPDTTRPAGIIQYSFKPKCQHTAEIGIMLSKGITGRGVGKKANLLLFQQLLTVTDLKRVYARIHKSNVVAHKLYTHLGYRRVSNHRKPQNARDLWLADKSVFGG